MSTLLSIVNAVLRRTGQQEVQTLVNCKAPALQTIDFTNDIHSEILQRLPVNRLQKQTMLDTIVNTVSYTLPSDVDANFIITDSVIETNSLTLLKEVDYTYELSEQSVTGVPEAFYIKGDKLYLIPTPDKVYTLQYDYYVKPEILTGDTDTLSIPEEWEHILILGIQARVEKFLVEPAAETTYLMYRDGLMQLKHQGASKPYHRMRGFYRGAH